MKLAHHWGINGVCARCLAIRNGNDSAICSGRKTARQAARDREPLDGADAQALEGALAMTERELAAAEERNREIVRERDVLQEELGRLRWGVAANAPRLSNAMPRWAAVREATGLGSTSARQLCVDAGLDPDAEEHWK